MKVLTAEQIREWDQFTITQEPVSSLELMERAAMACFQWLQANDIVENKISVFCGKGNNGGDGLAIARLLSARKYDVRVFILEFGHKGTEDFQANLARLHDYPEVEIKFIQSKNHFPEFEKGEIIIDALFGSGLNRGLEAVTAELVDHLNRSGNRIISIDIPSGLFVDRSSKGNVAIKASHTLSFQSYKPAFLVAENADSIGDLSILDIRLDSDYYYSVPAEMEMLGESTIRSIYKPRNPFAHKGNFGHALLIAGSYGKIGAAVLSAKACLRSGAGLLTCHIPKCGYDILQTAVPEAMVMTDFNSSIITKIDEDLSKFTSIGIGPGIGTSSETKLMLKDLIKNYQKPMVLDADALNCLASEKKWMNNIPAGSILTPHPKEFERLFGKAENDFERINLAKEKANELNAIIILKGHHSVIASPGEKIFFNSTGNAGMAKGGSGDVLTGLLTALLAQGYSSLNAALVGTWLHGKAADLAVPEISREALLATDIIDHIGKAYLSI